MNAYDNNKYIYMAYNLFFISAGLGQVCIFDNR